jgi:TonB family protein
MDRRDRQFAPDVGTAMEPTPSVVSSPSPLGSRLLRPPRRAGRWLVLVSLVVHAGAIAAYLVVGMMRIEQLKPERGRVEVAMRRQPDPGGGLEPGERPAPPKPEHRRVTTDRVQPRDHVEVAPETPQTPTATTGTGTALTTGDPTLPPGPVSGDCVGPSCSDDPTPTTGVPRREQPPTVELPETVAPPVIQKLRISGDTQIHPSDVTRTAMLRDGKSKVLGIVKLCLDTAGRVTHASVVKSTGFADYDRLLVGGVRTWRYTPVMIAGRAVPVCSTVSFSFSMK